ncbi:MAG: hypothetical protein IPN57_14605 [Ignavibacteria bacterium]|nr:hypothetical protein [Ignavibacteria bacterium]
MGTRKKSGDWEQEKNQEIGNKKKIRRLGTRKLCSQSGDWEQEKFVFGQSEGLGKRIKNPGKL